MQFQIALWDDEWPSAIASLQDKIHPADRDAVKIWFQLYPLSFAKLVEDVEPGSNLERFYQLKGRYRLADAADDSHRFLAAHRYWPAAKAALQRLKPDGATSLVGLIQNLASQIEAPQDLALSISAIALMTLRQAGTPFLNSGYTSPADRRSPRDILAQRAVPLRAGIWEKLKGSKVLDRVIFDEARPDAHFPILADQEITTAAELDKRPFHEIEARCYAGMGPIPVDCRAGSCGTCWVGILGGNENLRPATKFELERMTYFGYWDSDFHDANSERPLIRLACQTQATGSVSIVIPPWNGVFGESRRTRERGQLE